MAITFPKFNEQEKAGTLAVAAQILAATPGTDPKAAAVSAALATVHAISIRTFLPLLDQAVMTTNMMATSAPGSPEFNAAMNANVGNALDSIREKLGVDVFNAIASDVKMEEAGRTYDVAKALADALVAAATPTEAGRGKWLSAVGIVKKDLDGLVKDVAVNPAGATAAAPPTTSVPPPPPPPATTSAPPAGTPMSDAELLAAMGLAPAPAAETAPASTPAKGGRKPKSTEAAAAQGDLALAWKSYGDSIDLDTVKFAENFGIGRATLLNWMNGKTKPKLDKEHGKKHIQTVLADVALRAAALQKAHEEFSKILGGLG